MKTLKSAAIILIIVAMATMASAQQVYVTKKGYIIATSKENIKKVINYISAKDYKAVESLIAQHRAMMLKPGKRVYIEDRSWGLIEIRSVGKTDTVWTVMEAVERE